MTDERRIYIFDQERCVMCGIPIPEGRQVCIRCESAINNAPPPQNPRQQKAPDER